MTASTEKLYNLDPLIKEEQEVIGQWSRKFGIGRAKGTLDDNPVNADFSNAEVLEWWKRVENFQTTKPIAIFLPCAKANISNKIIQDSVTHKYFAKHITRWKNPLVEKLIVSEPLTIIPYTYTNYPFYNYPPPLLRHEDLLRRRPRDYHLFVTRLQLWLERQSNPHLWIWFGISRNYHHPRILQAAWTINEPCFVAVPRGGTKNIGRAAHCLRFIIEQCTTNKNLSDEEDSLNWDSIEFFVLYNENQSLNPSVKGFLDRKVSKTFFRDLIKIEWKKINESTKDKSNGFSEENSLPILYPQCENEIYFLFDYLTKRKGKYNGRSTLKKLLSEIPISLSQSKMKLVFNNISKYTPYFVKRKASIFITESGLEYFYTSISSI